MIKDCPKCGSEFESTSKWGDERQFCSRKCANSRTHSEETKKKIKDKLKDCYVISPTRRTTINKSRVVCPYCNKEFERYDSLKTIYCSRLCSNKHTSMKKRLSMDQYLRYKSECKFKFNIYKYPEYFDLQLIETYGWYSASNRGNNCNGISRDHKISVRFGFDNNIDSKIISHPANCKLMFHRDNNKKNTRCDITLDGLLSLVLEWNNKYESLA